MPPTLQAALLGVVQGLTEFLPVSSTAHLLIGGRLVGYQDPGGVFTVMIQLGSILAVMWLYRATIVGGMLFGLDRPAAAEFSFFLAMPTMAAAFAHDLLEVRGHLGSARALEIAIGFVTAFLASALVVKPFLNYVRRSGFAPFAWYRIVAGAALFAAVAAGWL